MLFIVLHKSVYKKAKTTITSIDNFTYHFSLYQGGNCKFPASLVKGKPEQTYTHLRKMKIVNGEPAVQGV